MNNISLRLLTIAKLINKGENVADIGSDHGYLPIFLAESGFDNQIFAVENKIGPFKILKRNCEKYRNIFCSLSNGIDEINDSVDTLVLAGMGAHTIKDILSNKNKLKNIKNIIIDSHTNNSLIREYIVSLGFYIKDEKIVLDMNKYYTIIRFERGEANYSFEELMFGPTLLKSKPQEFYSFWNDRKLYLSNIKENNLSISKLNEVDKELQIIEEVLA